MGLIDEGGHLVVGDARLFRNGLVWSRLGNCPRSHPTAGRLGRVGSAAGLAGTVWP